MIRAATDRQERLPTVSSAWTTVKGLVCNPWQLQIALRMPGTRHRGPLPPLSESQRSLSEVLRRDVTHLSVTIGERNWYTPQAYELARAWLFDRLQGAGLVPIEQPFACNGKTCVNLWGDLVGRTRPHEIVLVGSHYDSLKDCPAANDNGSGVAATLALMDRLCGGERPDRTVRFAFFANEEPPFFWTRLMGSVVMADACRARGDRIVAMLTPETIGCYKDEPGSQRYPLPLVRRWYGDKGDFVAFVGMGSSADLVRQCVGLFRQSVAFPSMGCALPSMVPGVGASDHWSFWRRGYPAVMVTDTAPFRYRQYHTRLDLPDKIDFERMARVVDGLAGVVSGLAVCESSTGRHVRVTSRWPANSGTPPR